MQTATSGGITTVTITSATDPPDMIARLFLIAFQQASRSTLHTYNRNGDLTAWAPGANDSLTDLRSVTTMQQWKTFVETWFASKELRIVRFRIKDAAPWELLITAARNLGTSAELVVLDLWAERKTYGFHLDDQGQPDGTPYQEPAPNLAAAPPPGVVAAIPAIPGESAQEWEAAINKSLAEVEVNKVPPQLIDAVKAAQEALRKLAGAGATAARR